MCFRNIIRQGLPSNVNMLTIGLGVFVIIYHISRSGEIGIAAYGIAVRIEQIVLLPTIGLNMATLTIVFPLKLIGVWLGILVMTWSAALFTLVNACRLLSRVLGNESQVTPETTGDRA